MFHATAAAAQEPTFEAAVESFGGALAGELAGRSARLVAGEGAAADAALRARAEAAGTPEAWFVVGNLLWSRDPAASLALHRRAWEARPEEPLAALEWALELHRADRCAEAAPRYRQVLGDRAGPEGAGEPVSWLLAHCLVVEGDADAAWAALSPPGPPGPEGEAVRAEAESLLADVFAPVDPWRVRDRLLREAAADPARWLDVLAWDTAFPRSPWDVGPEPDALVADRRAAGFALAADPAALEEAAVFVAARVGDAPVDGLADLSPANLPTSFPVAEAILGARLARGDAAAVLGAVRRDLTRRARRDDGALTLLAAVTAEADPDALPRLDARGCARGLPVFCASALAGPRPPPLAEVRRRLPHDPRIPAVALLAQGDRPDPALLRAWLADAPRLAPDAESWRAGLAVLRDRLADRAPDPVVLALARRGMVDALARPWPACGSWEGPERLATGLCARPPARSR